MCLVRGTENFLQFSAGERETGEGGGRGGSKNNLNPEGHAGRGNKVTHGNT